MSAPLVDQLGGEALAITLGGVQLPGDQVGPVSIRHGRDDPSQPINPSSCQLTAYSDQLTRLPRIGDPLHVELGAGAVAYTGLAGDLLDVARVRFTGHVDHVVAAPPRRGTRPTVRVSATSRRARLARTRVGDAPWPVELDGARAARILALAAPVVGAPVGLLDEGQVAVVARDVDAQPALDLLNQLALDSGGQLVELRDGTLTWHDHQHRRRSAVDVELTAAQVLAAVVAEQRLAGLVNALSITYGPVVEGGQRPSTTYEDVASVDSFGPFAASLSSQLQNLADAESLARLTVGRRSRPAWEVRQLQVELLRTVPAATAAALLRLQHADLVGLVGFPEAGPFSAARVWVEGWTETVTRTSWGMQLDVSDYGRNGPEPRWVDLNPDLTWAEADLTWLQAVGWDSGPGRGDRWVDLPSDERWSTYEPTPTWATAS